MTKRRPTQRGRATGPKRKNLLRQIAALGPVLQGTITERVIVREDPNAPGKTKEYGPYYQWTRKKEGKTVTVNLSASQHKVYTKAIDEHRKLEEYLEQLREASLHLLEATTQGVHKRKTRSDGNPDKMRKKP